MNCKHCGGVNPPGEKVCQFCGSELQEKEKVYVPIHEYDSPPPAAGVLRKKLYAEGGKAMAMAILSMVFGFVVIRTILALIALISANTLIKEARKSGVEVPSMLIAARTVAISSLFLAAIFAAIGFLMLTGQISFSMNGY